jgi:uncharacterized membrane protein
MDTAKVGAAFVGLELADACLTTWAVSRGFVELNQVVAPFIGTWVFPAVKVAPAVLAVLAAVKVARRWRRTETVVGMGLLASVVFMTAVLASNLFELYNGL